MTLASNFCEGAPTAYTVVTLSCDMATDVTVELDVQDAIDPDQTLLVGLSNIGLAGFTAADHLTKQCDSSEIGHVRPEIIPAITPFEEGIPRHHTRLYDLHDSDLIVLVGELFVPVPAARAFADALSEWVTASQVTEVAVLHGVPFPHSHDTHEVSYVATDEYRDRHLADTAFDPLTGGHLDGTAGEFLTRSMEGEAPPVGVYVTPTHPPGPDIEASMLFLDAIETVYDVAVDQAALKELSAEINQYYTELADRMAALEEQEHAGPRDFPEDRMFM